MPAPSRPARWMRLDRPRLGALVAAALVVSVGLPLWVSQDHGPPPRSPAAVEHAAPVAPRFDVAPEVAPPVAEAAPAEPKQEAQLPASPVRQAARATAESGVADSVEPPPPAIVAMPAPAAPAQRSFSLREESDAANIVVTGSRVAPDRARAAKASGAAEPGSADRSACASDDHSVCERESDAASTTEGLALARRGDLDGAIAALDRAIQAAPDSAEAYRQRARLLRRKGNARQAEADERRAAELTRE